MRPVATEKLMSPFVPTTVGAKVSWATSLKNGSHQTPLNKPEYKLQIVWLNTTFFFVLNVISLYGAYEFFTNFHWSTFCYMTFLVAFSGLGITGGAHRLWTHKCYKAKVPLQIFLAICNLTAYQNSIFEWVRDHRVHHKFTDTDADPHNSKRGFFFSHMGWLMVKKHPDVKRKGKTIDMSDLESDPIVMFQHKYYFYLMPIFAFILPAVMPVIFCGTNFWYSFRMYSITRWCYTLHGTWCVNSVAHMFGYKPYDRFITSTQNIWVSLFVLGEGWHNYHHAFPWDYKASEFPYYANFTTAFIDFCAWLGLAYDLKTVKQDVINRRALRTGNGSHASVVPDSIHENNDIWGWDDEGLTDKQREMASISYCGERNTFLTTFI